MNAILPFCKKYMGGALLLAGVLLFDHQAARAQAPVNDDCAGAINIPVQFGSCVIETLGDNTGSTSSSATDPSCASYTGEDIWFKVTVPVSGALTIQTTPPSAGSDVLDTGMSVYSGTCANLSEEGCSDDQGIDAYSLLDFTGRMPGEVLYVRVWSYGGNTTGTFALCATSPSNCGLPLTLSASPVTTTTAQLGWDPGMPPAAGESYDIEYGLQGFSPGSGTAVTNVTTNGYLLTGLQASQAYCYYVRKNCGAANGSSDYVGPFCFVTLTPAPANDEPCGALDIVGNTNSSSVGATTSQQAGVLPGCLAAASPLDVWFTFTATTANQLLGLNGTAASNVRVFTATDCTVGPFTQVFCQSSTAPNQALGSVQLTSLTVGTRYYVAVSSSSAASAGPFVVSLLAPVAIPANNEPCAATNLLSATVTGTTVGASISQPGSTALPVCQGVANTPDVWFDFTATTGSELLTLTGAAAGVVQVFTTPDCAAGPFTLVFCQASSSPNQTLGAVTVTSLTVGTHYYVAISGVSGTPTGSFSITASRITGNRATMATDALLVYPNPSNTGQLAMRLTATHSTSQFSLLNALGQKVLTGDLPAATTEHTLNTRGLATGVYTLRVQMGQTVLTRKVVLE